jgi:hypothetical protein
VEGRKGYAVAEVKIHAGQARTQRPAMSASGFASRRWLRAFDGRLCAPRLARLGPLLRK